MLVRSRPRFLDPQLTRGEIRLAEKRGFNFTAILADNQRPLAETAAKHSTRLVMTKRPPWCQISCLVRVGISADIGELHIIQDLIEDASLEIRNPLNADYVVSDTETTQPLVTLLGIPGSFFALGAPGFERKVLLIESWYKLVPGDAILASPSPDFLDSLSEYELRRCDLIGTRPGLGVEPAVVYRYEVELADNNGLLSFMPEVDLPLFVKAQPMYQVGDFNNGDIKLPEDVGPCLVDAFFGDMLYGHSVKSRLGIKAWDSFGGQINLPLTGNQEWQPIPHNYLLLERPMASEAFILWQRIKGQFQLLRGGFFQAELASDGEFVMSSDLLVPKWNTDRQHGWVAPLLSQGPITVSVQFEPQPPQIFHVPANTLTFIRPKLLVDPKKHPIDRLVIAFKGFPHSKVEMRTWEYDGPVINSLSYYMMGSNAFGVGSWMSGGFCVKPLFYSLDVLKGRYSDGNTRYDSGYIYL